MAIIHGMPFENYQALEAWNWGTISEIEKSPKHVKYKRTHRDEGDTADRTKLRAIHCYVFEGREAFDERYPVFEGMRRQGKAWTEFEEAHPGREILKRTEADEAVTAALAILEHPEIASLLSVGHGEVTITWTDEATGLPCKGRIDWLAPGAFADLKTIGTTHERIVAGRVAQNLWYGQVAHYEAGLAANGLEDLIAYIIAAEGKGANDVALFELTPGMPDGALHVGRRLRRKYMEQLAQCVRLNHWPGRHEKAIPLCLPSYALDGDVMEITASNAENEEEVF